MMRVYELAREINISTKELIKALVKKGFEVNSHMAVLSEEAIAMIRAANNQSAQSTTKIKNTITKTTEQKIVSHQDSETKKSDQKKAKKIKKPVAPSGKKSPHHPRKNKNTANKSNVRASNSFKKRTLGSPVRTQQHVIAQHPVVTHVTVTKDKPLHAVAAELGKSSGEVILALLKKGMVCNRNALLNKQTIILLAKVFGITVTTASEKEVKIDRHVNDTQGSARWPIVVVMGHVDHGKTTFLDRIRKMNTAAKEKGGITQHLAAYEVDSTHGKIVFLDTPGHEAFSYIRKRGAHVTDIAILVIAADDGVKPQTIEAIKHAQTAQVPIVVAINKVDKVKDRVAAIERIKRQLAEQHLLAEDWGGQTICVPISAKTGEGIQDLLEMVTLQAELLENKADPDAPAKAFVLESKLERGYGPVATVICLEGTLNIGDYFLCGSAKGRVRILINSAGKKVQQAGPSVPVQLVGFDAFTSLGDWLHVVSRKEYARARSSKKRHVAAAQTASNPVQKNLQSDLDYTIDPIVIILKADTHGSLQALKDSIGTMQKNAGVAIVPIRIIHAGIGDTSESDVLLAIDTGAIIMTLHVKAERNALLFAQEKSVQIHSYQVVYHLLEYIATIIDKRRQETTVLKKIGQAVVKKVFDLKTRGVIAGCYVSDGKVKDGAVVVCYRNEKKIGQGVVKSLQRERKVVPEVYAKQECGFITDIFHGWQVEDTVVVFEKVQHTELGP